MKKRIRWLSVLPALSVAFWLIQGGPASGADVRDRLRYSCSAQIHEAFGDKMVKAFSETTGIEVENHVTSSISALNRLMKDSADIAGTTRRLYDRQKKSGYVETPFCRNPLAVIVNVLNPVENLTNLQLQEIFSGKITNWKEAGGPDQALVVVIPEKNTGAYKNFARDAMRHKEIVYDLMTYKSTRVIEVVKRFPWAVSFIAQADAAGQDIKMVSLNGTRPLDPNYPYHQVFSFVTKGRPEGSVKAFIDFVFSGEGKEIMKKKGQIALPR
jgi:phosphate transport system substrate-binding protein